MRGTGVDAMIEAGPRWRRPGLRILLGLVRRPRALALLSRIPPADQALTGLAAMARYDEPELAKELGWDADAVINRGRALRHAEGRP